MWRYKALQHLPWGSRGNQWISGVRSVYQRVACITTTTTASDLLLSTLVHYGEMVRFVCKVGELHANASGLSVAIFGGKLSVGDILIYQKTRRTADRFIGQVALEREHGGRS